MPLTEQQKQRLNAIEELKRIKLVAEKVAKLQLKDVKQDVAQLEADLSNLKNQSEEFVTNDLLANEVRKIEGLIESMKLDKDELTSIIKPLIPEVKDGKDGRNPIFIGKEKPINPQKGDLWYQD